MARVLFLIQDGSTVDLSDPALPKDITPAKVKGGIENSMNEMKERGWQGELLAIKPTDAGIKTMQEKLTSATYDCVVVGGAIRLPRSNLEFFEKVVNGIREASPDCAIAFNGTLTDMHDAAGRWVESGRKK